MPYVSMFLRTHLVLAIIWTFLVSCVYRILLRIHKKRIIKILFTQHSMFSEDLTNNAFDKILHFIDCMRDKKTNKLKIQDETFYCYKKLQLMLIFINNFKAFDKRVFSPIGSLQELQYSSPSEIQTDFTKWMHMLPANINKAEAKFIRETVSFFDSLNQPTSPNKPKWLYYRLLDVFIFDQVDMCKAILQADPNMIWSHACIWCAVSCNSIKILNLLLDHLNDYKKFDMLGIYFNNELFQSVVSNPACKSSVYNWLLDLNYHPTINQYCDNYITMSLPLLESMYVLFEHNILSLSTCQLLAFETIKAKQWDRLVYILLHTIRHFTSDFDTDSTTHKILDYVLPEDTELSAKKEMLDCVATYCATGFKYCTNDPKTVENRKKSIIEVYAHLLMCLDDALRDGYKPNTDNIFWQEFFAVIKSAFDRGGKKSSKNKYIAKYVESQYTKREKLDPLLLTFLPNEVVSSVGEYVGSLI